MACARCTFSCSTKAASTTVVAGRRREHTGHGEEAGLCGQQERGVGGGAEESGGQRDRHSPVARHPVGTRPRSPAGPGPGPIPPARRPRATVRQTRRPVPARRTEHRTPPRPGGRRRMPRWRLRSAHRRRAGAHVPPARSRAGLPQGRPTPLVTDARRWRSPPTPGPRPIQLLIRVRPRPSGRSTSRGRESRSRLRYRCRPRRPRSGRSGSAIRRREASEERGQRHRADLRDERHRPRREAARRRPPTKSETP